MQKKLILIPIIIALLTSSCSLKKPISGIDINSTPESTIFINDKEVGKTPYTDKKISPGEYTIKLVSTNGEWTSNQIRISENTIYGINRELSTNPEDQGGESISLEKGKGLAIVTIPSQAEIRVDGEKKDQSPLLIQDIASGKHEISISKSGYISRTIKINAIDGYKVVVNAQLPRETDAMASQTPKPSTTPEATPSGSPTASPKATATPRATATAKPTATPTVSESPTPSKSPTVSGKSVTINSNTGWLRVRSKPSSDGEEITKVNNGEVYPYDEQLDTGWTSITLTDGTKGYVVTRYITVNK